MLDDKYRVESLLAVGGMGAVYRGTHTKLQKTVAIKVLKRELLGAPELVERFQREAVAASQIGHEGIIEVTDIGTSAAGDPFLVMEFLEGRDLATCLRALGPMAAGTAVRLGIEILSALAAAHDKNIIHRDLKPENVFVCKRSLGERLKIVDFGISRMPIEGDDSMRLTTTGMVMGTPYYMSPEQALGDSTIGKAADLYSVGVILYELITGAVPYRATNYNALLHQILMGEYPPASQLAAVPPELEAVITKAMSTHPEDRHTSARAFADALRGFAETSPTPVLRAGEWQPDTLDETEPGLATAPTRASSPDQGIATLKTEYVADASGQDTLGPVVTPVPEDSMPRSSRKGLGVIAALLTLLVAGGATAFLVGGNEQEAKSAKSGLGPAPQTTSETAPGAVPETGAPQPMPEPTVPLTAAEGAEPAPVTMTFAIAPHDAQIYVDGVEIEGKSVERPAGSFVIEVKRDGFTAQVRSVDVQSDQKLAFVLEASATVPTASEPAAAAAEPGARGESRRGAKKNRKAARDSNDPAPNTPKNRRFVEDSPYDAP